MATDTNTIQIRRNLIDQRKLEIRPGQTWNIPASMRQPAMVSTASGALVNQFFTQVRNQPRLHKENGPAVFYDNGTVGYFWHGVRVPSWLIMNPERITLKIILREKNIELRRCLIERFGEGKFLKEVGAEKEHEDKWGILWKVDRDKISKEDRPLPSIGVGLEIRRLFGNVRKLKYVQVKDSSTDREYFLPVPSTMKKAKQAIAWSFKLKEEEYNPQIQT